ncbi:MAG: TonB family protein [Opitutaceae bacterium]|nr:TonB family protein [Opitutaceae bacterium]
MRPNSPSSLLVSLTLHAFVAAVVFVTTVFVAKRDELPPVIFELVAGEPTAPDELVAPALGNTDKVTLNVPEVDLPPEPPEAAKEELAPPPEPAVPPKPAPKPVEKAVEKPVEKAPAKPKPDQSMVKELKKSAKISYQEYLKKHPTPKRSTASNQPRKAANVPRIDAQGIAGGVRGGSTANTRGGGGGKALTREEQNALNTYISLLIQELKRAHEPPPGVSDRLEARVTFDITASGAIINPRISRSSGNKEFDDSVIDAFRRMRSIGPTPNRKSDTWTVTFKMRDE